MTVREGYLLKRKDEPTSLATRFAFKKRYFRLSGEMLSYSKSPEWQVRLPGVTSSKELTLCTQGDTEVWGVGKDLPKASWQLNKSHL